MNVGQCVLTLYPSQDDLESCSRDTVQSETPGGAYLICIVFIVYQHPCLLLIHIYDLSMSMYQHKILNLVALALTYSYTE